MNEKPILFSGPMVQAILSGAKSVTRRVVNPDIVSQPDPSMPDEMMPEIEEAIKGDIAAHRCPYGKPGDRLDAASYGIMGERYQSVHKENPEDENDGRSVNQANSGIPERRLHGGRRRTSVLADTIQGVREEGFSGLVSTEGTQAAEGLHHCDSLPRESQGNNVDSSAGVYGISRDAGETLDAGTALGRQPVKQCAGEPQVGNAIRELAGPEGTWALASGRDAPCGETEGRRAGAFTLGAGEGSLQSEARSTNAGDVAILNSPDRRQADRLWVRESFYAYGQYRYTGNLTDSGKREVEFLDLTHQSAFTYQYATDVTLPKPASRYELGWHKRPSIVMPRWASRITLDIKSVGVERLNDITEEDAIAEGIQRSERTGLYPSPSGNCDYAAWAFKYLWDSINGKRPGCSWADNPFVWRIEFQQVASASVVPATPGITTAG